MTQSAHSPSPTKGPLDAAQKIVAELQGMTNDQQVLAVTFATETLGLQLPTAHAPLMHAPVQSPSVAAPAVPVAHGQQQTSRPSRLRKLLRVISSLPQSWHITINLRPPQLREKNPSMLRL